MIHPDFGLPVRYSTEVVGGGPDEQVERTISLMGKYVLEDLRDPLGVRRGPPQLCSAPSMDKVLIWEPT